MLVHATTILVDDTGVLIRGPSGSGKSDLALRLIDGGASLVADDQTELQCSNDVLLARAPDAIAGLLEVRGLGIVRLPFAAEARVGLVVDLVTPGRVERLPESKRLEILGISLPWRCLAPFEASAPAKVRLAVVCCKMDIIAAPDRPTR